MKVLPQPTGDRSGQICNENIAFKVFCYLLTKVFMVKKYNYQLIFKNITMLFILSLLDVRFSFNTTGIS